MDLRRVQEAHPLMLRLLLNALTLGGVLSGLFVAALWAFDRYPKGAPWFVALYALAAANSAWLICRASR